MTENVEVAVIGHELEELMFRAVPLIDHFLHKIFVIVQSKAERSLVSFASGVTLNVQSHLTIDAAWAVAHIDRPD